MTFTKGGYLISPLAMVFACFCQSLAAVKLVQVAVKYNTFTYPGIAELALGPIGRNVCRCTIAIASF